MFPLQAPGSFFHSVRGALQLARDFLTLEDDYDVDWGAEYRHPELDFNDLELSSEELEPLAPIASVTLGAPRSWAGRARLGVASSSQGGAERDPALAGHARRSRRRGQGAARTASRRAGQPSPAAQLCISPVRRAPAPPPPGHPDARRHPRLPRS